MQISNLLSSSIAPEVSASAGKQGIKSPLRQSGGEDHVHISSLASQLSASNPSKLSQLKAAYEAGTYHVSPSQIAKSILNDALMR
jgi:anti-sigma28 factor (negative regulator of flagellin synthesis)